MRVLLIDNYDSFAYNLVQALGALGAAVLVRRNDALSAADALALSPDAVVLSPGPCTPAEAGISVDLVRASAAAGVPLLGVCLGHQSIGVAFGGSVVRAPRLLHGKTSGVVHDGSGLFDGLTSPLTAARYHSLTLAEPLPPALVPTARTARGELMACAHRELPILGVQFHPESYLTAEGDRLLGNFLEITRARAPREAAGAAGGDPA